MKVLLISHNPCCTYNGMGKTFVSLFSEFSREELCQLYIYPSYPDLDTCASYYRITDKEVLRSLCIWKNPGRPVDPSYVHKQQSFFEDERDEALYRNKKNKSPLRRLGRDLIWKLSHWYTPELRAWLDQEAPTCIFVAPGPAKFLYEIAERISRVRRIPIAVYICDEYYFLKTPRGMAGMIQHRLLRRKMEKLMDCASQIVAISPELKDLYAKRFSVPAEVIMTGSGIRLADRSLPMEKGETVSFFGNVRSNRYDSLAEIGRVLDTINEEHGTSCQLLIYTAEKDSEIRGVLAQNRSTVLCPFLQGTAFEAALRTSGLLLHVEAFDERSKDRVKHSISTKIADSLSSGVPLLAYGPMEVSSMRHLERNGCAFLAGGPDELKQTLQRALTDVEARRACVEHALETAARCHNAVENSQRLHRLLENMGREHI